MLARLTLRPSVVVGGVGDKLHLLGPGDGRNQQQEADESTEDLVSTHHARHSIARG